MGSSPVTQTIIVSAMIQCRKCTHLVGAFFRAWVQNKMITAFDALTKRLTAKTPLTAYFSLLRELVVYSDFDFCAVLEQKYHTAVMKNCQRFNKSRPDILIKSFKNGIGFFQHTQDFLHFCNSAFSFGSKLFFGINFCGDFLVTCVQFTVISLFSTNFYIFFQLFVVFIKLRLQFCVIFIR